MKTYPTYKESGNSWIGNIPEHWDVLRLKRFASVVNGSTPQSSTEEYWDGEIVWLTPVDLGKLNDKKEITDSARKITELGLNNCGASLTPKGSIILSTRAPIGHLALTDVESCTNQGCKTIVPNFTKINNSYLFYYLWVFKEILQSLGQGSTFVELSGSNLKDFPSPFPPLPEQQSIADFLDRKTAQIDTLIEKKQRQIELFREQRTALINHAVTKGLNPDAPMKDSGVEWLGDIPDHWKQIRLKHVCSVKGRIGFRGYTTDDLVNEGEGAFVFGATQISASGIIDLSSPVFISWDKYYESPEIMVSKGDVLIVQRGSTCGKIGYVGENFGQTTINPSLVLLRNHKINSKFLFYSMTAKAVKNQADILISKTAIPMLSQEQIGNFYLPLPDSNEQQKIVEFLDAFQQRLNQMVNSIEQAIKLLQEYRTAIISEAVTGKIDVRTEELVMTGCRGAVLIIGSLWWELTPTRVNWRNSQLDIDNKQVVYAPIRYGRLSESRHNTYTMVFSSSCYNEGMGKAFLVPFKTKTKNIDELIIEAKKLWIAEGGIFDRISGTWGAVGLLVNPDSNFPSEIIDGWKSFYKNQERRPDFKAIGHEIPSLSDDGMLTLQWLKDVENEKVTDFDFILATATLPNNEYPTPETIARACFDNQYTEYFDENRKHGIATFQDEEIMNFLHSKK